jgi:hypothetical protein
MLREVSPQLIEAMLASFGRRMTYAVIGVLIAVAVWPVSGRAPDRHAVAGS